MNRKKAILIELSDEEYAKLLKNSNIVSIDFNVLYIKYRKKTTKTSYEILNDSILKQYLIKGINEIHELHYHMKRQLTKLHKCLLEHKRLGFAAIKNFSHSYVDLSNCDLSNIDFTEAHFNGADFRNSNLTNCDFTKADLSGADFSGANLENAKLDGASIGIFPSAGIYKKKTNFTGANLKGTIYENNC